MTAAKRTRTISQAVNSAVPTTTVMHDSGYILIPVPILIPGKLKSLIPVPIPIPARSEVWPMQTLFFYP